MDINFENNNEREYQGAVYGSFTGRIVEILPHGVSGLNSDGCSMLVTVEAKDNNITNFVVNPTTYVVDYLTLEVGMECTFWYFLNAPAVLIYPPRFNASVVAPVRDDRMVEVAYFDEELINDKKTLKLNLSQEQVIYTTNNQKFMGSPAGRDLVIEYDFTTRSIPAQTTPLKVVVLCGMNLYV